MPASGRGVQEWGGTAPTQINKTIIVSERTCLTVFHLLTYLQTYISYIIEQKTEWYKQIFLNTLNSFRVHSLNHHSCSIYNLCESHQPLSHLFIIKPDNGSFKLAFLSNKHHTQRFTKLLKMLPQDDGPIPAQGKMPKLQQDLSLDGFLGEILQPSRSVHSTVLNFNLFVEDVFRDFRCEII